ncbi:CDP-alcohol phosphatidyltransferase [Thraustotheca clavata]|uniref:CDP-alcohol phosphatidyltransferase n=1 Tax=Thraustotheca clavata TaxID=74557 RepID=A0A1V9ZK66_9STRA|nr:CDP-alcohol phosphatidyltransferase [Thraustotheca clavata]
MSGKYVSTRGAERVLEYKYSGSDASFLYNYIVSPLAQRIVDGLFPSWLAPNTITISGLALVAISHIFMAIYAPGLDQAAPSWVYAFASFALATYQVLDVTDGKQARKTGNSSPLGLLFDHGCDAVNCVLSACTMASTMLMGPTYMSMGLLICPACVFFMATWEEYYTGTLALGIVNGPNEGLAIMYFIYALTAFTGPEIWAQPSFLFPSIPNNLLFLIITSMGSLGQIFVNVVNVYNTLKDKPLEFVNALLGAVPFLVLVAVSALWVALSPYDVVQYHPRILMWTTGLMFCKMVMHMMLAHLCDEPYWLLRKSLAAMLVAAGLAVAGLVPFVHEATLAYGFFTLTLIVYFHMVYYVIIEMTTILKIKVFRVKDKAT